MDWTLEVQHIKKEISDDEAQDFISEGNCIFIKEKIAPLELLANIEILQEDVAIKTEPEGIDLEVNFILPDDLKTEKTISSHSNEMIDPYLTNFHKCGMCEYTSSRRGNLATHMRIHTGEKPFKCKICEYKSPRNADVQNHMRIHTGEKPFECKLCEYKGSRSSGLSAHMKSHTREKPLFQCSLCEFACTKKNKLYTHISTHIINIPPPTMKKVKTVPLKNLLECEVCGYTSVRKDNFQTHMRKHTGEKPFHCNICNYKSARSIDLQYHMRTHTGEKPYQCKLCEFKCSRSSGLSAHVKNHTGVKAFECNFCGYNVLRKVSYVITSVRILEINDLDVLSVTINVWKTNSWKFT